MNEPGATSDPAELKRRLLLEATAYQRLRQHVADARRQEQHWLERVELARSRGRNDLAEQASAKALEHRERAGFLEADLIEQQTRVEELRQSLRTAGPGPAMDATQLLASLDVDLPEAQLAELERQAQVDRDLAELKAKIGGSSEEPPAEDAPTDDRRTE